MAKLEEMLIVKVILLQRIIKVCESSSRPIPEQIIADEGGTSPSSHPEGASPGLENATPFVPTTSTTHMPKGGVSILKADDQVVILTTFECYPLIAWQGYHPHQRGKLVLWSESVRRTATGFAIYLNMDACLREGLQFMITEEGIVYEGLGSENLIPPFMFSAIEDLDEGIWLMGEPDMMCDEPTISFS